MKNGDRYVFVTHAGSRVDYVVDGGVGQHGDTEQPQGVVRLRNPKTGGYARVYERWLTEGTDSVTAAHWEKAA